MEILGENYICILYYWSKCVTLYPMNNKIIIWAVLPSHCNILLKKGLVFLDPLLWVIHEYGSLSKIHTHDQSGWYQYFEIMDTPTLKGPKTMDPKIPKTHFQQDIAVAGKNGPYIIPACLLNTIKKSLA